MIITIYGIIVFMLALWLERKEECEDGTEIVMLGFSYNAVPSRHQVTRKPIGSRRKRYMT